jgi:predicted DNA-binding transcriptional regulator AlpA
MSEALQASPDPDVIDYLEELLEQAKSGGSIEECLAERSTLDISELPPWALLRANDIVGRKVSKKKNTRHGPRLLPLSQSTWWEGVKTGKYPPGKKIGSMRLWTVQEIKDLAEELASES